MVTIDSARRKRNALFDTWPFDHAGEVGWSGDILFDPHLPHYGRIVEELQRRTTH